MGLSWAQRFDFGRRGVAVGKVARALRQAEGVGLRVTAEMLAAHDLAGGHVEACVAAWVRARELGVHTNWLALTTLDTEGVDPVRAVEQAAAQAEEEVTSTSADGERPIEATCRDGQRVRAVVTVRRKPEVTVFSDTVRAWQESVALRLMAAIRRAENPESLEAMRIKQEEELLRDLEGQASGLQELRVRYEKEPGNPSINP